MGKYTEQNISYFDSDLKKLRSRPAMYIGPLDDAGVFTITREAGDNAVDEARAGRNKLIHFFVQEDSIWVVDAGVGIPVKKHPKAKISTLTHVLTALQSSGKMSGDAYKSAIGTHGVGIKATNALSETFEVWTYRDDAGGWHYTKFERGVEKVKVEKAKAPKLPDGTRPKLGTVVKFWPDSKIFGKSKLQGIQLVQWAELTAYMNAGLKIKITNSKGKTKEWYSKDGIQEYLDLRLKKFNATPMNKKPLVYNSGTLELALSFADVEGCEVEFFTNTIRNVDKGFHADAFFKALKAALKEYAPKKTKKQKEDLYKAEDLQDGLVGVFNYKIDAPQFSSQTKEKLVDVRMKEPAYTECLDLLTKYFKANKALAKQIIQRAISLRKSTNAFLKDKKLAKKVKNISGMAAKLAGISANSKVPVEHREIYLVEGDSAGGIAEVARFKAFQATYKTRGKPLNVMEAKQDQVNKSREIASLLAALGVDLTKDDPFSTLRYGRIIYLADPDVDGKHIQCLFSAIFWKFGRHLFKQGKIFIVKSPEYMAKYKGKLLFGDSKKSIYKQAGTEKVDIRHIKGWAEVDATAMRSIAFEIGTRKLLRILPPKDKKGAQAFEELMGKKPEYRKKLLGVA